MLWSVKRPTSPLITAYRNMLTNQGRSSTIIDFRDFSVIRVGVQYQRLAGAFKGRFGVTLKEQTA